MGRAFISYSHKDSDFVVQLIDDLEKSSSLHLVYDKRCLKSGDSLLTIFGEIGSSDFLVPILSKGSVKSNWCKKELSVAIIKEIDEDSFTVVPVVIEKEKWSEIKKLMSPNAREALRDKLLCRFDLNTYDEALKNLIISLTPETTPEDIYSLMADPTGQNPFRRVRAEHFEDPYTFVNLFAEPSIAYNDLISPKPTFIEGGRGSGKTMILKSMCAHIAPLLKKQSTFEKSKITYFGVYFRATRDTFATVDIAENLDNSAIQGVFYDELVLRLAQSLIEEICICRTNRILDISVMEERHICEIFEKNLRLNNSSDNINDLKQEVAEQISLIIDYLRAKQRNDLVTYEVKSLTKDNLLRLCDDITNDIVVLRNTCIYFLIDEYENLMENQKIVLNTLIKWHEATKFSSKIAYKKTGFSTSQTLEVQELEDGPDYSYVNLDFNIGKYKSRYESYVKQICKNIMKKEGFSVTNIESILENRDVYIKDNDMTPEQILNEDIYQEVINLARKRKIKWDNLDSKRKKRELTHYKTASEYRLLKNRKISYGGFNDFLLLSSGIVRNFIELCGMSYYYAREDGLNIKNADLISIKNQTNAIYALSDYYLWRINKNIENFGPTIFSFVVDIGDIFRQKLLHNLSEPESITLSIRNPRKLVTTNVEIFDEKQNKQHLISDIINSAILHSVFQEYEKRGGRKTKNTYTGQTYDITLNRILTPALKISPRVRWLTKISTHQIKELLSNNENTKKELIKIVTSEDISLTSLKEFTTHDDKDE